MDKYMEFTAQVTLVKPEDAIVESEQSNVDKAKALIFEALKVLAEDDPTIQIDALAGQLVGEKETE